MNLLVIWFLFIINDNLQSLKSEKDTNDLTYRPMKSVWQKWRNKVEILI